MKTLTLILLVLVVRQSSSYLIRVPTAPSIQPQIAPIGWVHIQKLMLPLFENVCEDSTDPIVERLAKEFSLDSTNGDYTKTDVVSNYRAIQTGKGLLQKGIIFTEHNTDNMNEFRALYELFYFAKDFDTFYKSACWARQNVNCGLFVNALYLAVLNRRDTSKLSVPAPYELLPNYFISKDVIIKAASLLAGDETSAEDVRVEGNTYILDVNYTSGVTSDDEESKLVYFHEDIGLNSYYFLRKLRNSPWFNVPSQGDNIYGEYMYLMMKQFAARYDLERYANGLPELDSFSWDSVINAYDPMLIYSNGKEFGHRTFAGVLSESEDVAFLKTIENNLATVVTHLRQTGQNKTQILNHLMEILVTSDKNYQKLTSLLLGSDNASIERQYSVLDHYITSMRDPVFWKINKKIVELVDNALNVVPSYTKNELYFPGVEVLNIETKKMMTSFDDFQFDVTDSLRTVQNITFQVKIAQPRLNHKPFTLKLNISSLVMQKGLVKIFIGPKIMPGELVSKKNLFVLLDQFELNLKRGSNVVSRSSEEMKSYSDDFISIRVLKKKVEDAEYGLDALPLKDVESQLGYPSRLTLPKGLPEGLPVQLFVLVAPFYKNAINSPLSMETREFNTAIRSPGYPFDLRIDNKQLFNLPNALVKDIFIMHKGDFKSSNYGDKAVPKKWDPNSTYTNKPFDYSGKRGDNNVIASESIDYDAEDNDLDKMHNFLEDRPEFTYNKKDITDYTPKRNQYKNKTDYSQYKRSKGGDKVNDEEEDYKQDGKNDFDKKVQEGKNDLDTKGFAVIPITINDDVDKDNKDQSIIVKDELDTPAFPEKIHGLLGDRPAFTYKNKDTVYTPKKNQYKKKEDYAAKYSEYKNKDFKNKETEKNKTDDNNQDVAKKDFSNKFIVIEDTNDIVRKNIVDNVSNKDVFIDKLNNGKVDSFTKEVIKNPVRTYKDRVLEDSIDTPVETHTDEKTKIDISGEENREAFIVYEPIIDSNLPNKRIRVYDYLFNMFDDDKVYE